MATARATIGLCAIAVLGVLLPLQPLAAQGASRVAEASRFFDEAREAGARGDWSLACRRFEDSQRLDPQLGTQLHLADCYERIGRSASAWLNFRAAAVLAHERNERGQQEPRERVAQEHMKALSKRLSHLRLSVQNPSLAELSVQCDGRDWDRGNWATAKPIDPGPHVITASAPGRRPWVHMLTVSQDAEEVPIEVPELELLTPAASSTVSSLSVKPEAAESSMPWFHVAGYATSGVGAVALGVAIYVGVRALDLKSQRDRACSQECADEAARARFVSFQKSAVRTASTANILFAVGGVAVATGVTLLLLAPRGEGSGELSLSVAPSELAFRYKL